MVRGRSSVQSTPAAPISKTYSAPLGTVQQNTARTGKLDVEKTLNFVRGTFLYEERKARTNGLTTPKLPKPKVHQADFSIPVSYVTHKN